MTKSLPSGLYVSNLFKGDLGSLLCSIFGIDVCAWFLINIYATIFLLWSVMYKICDGAGFERGGKFSSYMCLAINFISGLRMVSKPFDAWYLIGFGALTNFMGKAFLSIT